MVTIGMTGKNYLQQELEKIETNPVKLEYAGKRRDFGTFSTAEKARQHERDLQYFKKY